jgi:hypothetical protein
MLAVKLPRDMGNWHSATSGRLAPTTADRRAFLRSPSSNSGLGCGAFAGTSIAASAEEQVLLGVEYGDLGGALERIAPELQAVVQATVLDGLTTREVAIAIITPMWCFAIVVTALERAPLSGSLVAGVTLELACFLTLGISIAGSLKRWADFSEPGVATAPTMVIALMALGLPIADWQSIVDPGGRWATAHQGWLLLWAAALLALGIAARDPAAPRYRLSLNRPTRRRFDVNDPRDEPPTQL